MSMQTSMSANPNAALVGMRADNGPFDAISRVLETAAGCAFGRILCEGAVEGEGAIIPTSAGEGGKPLGAVIRKDVSEPGSPDVAQKEDVTLLRKGRIWVEAAGTLTTAMRPGGTAIYLVHSGGDAGLLSPTDDATTVAIVGVTVLKGATDGNLALVEFNL